MGGRREKDTKRWALLSQTVVLPCHLRMDVCSPSPVQSRDRDADTHIVDTYTETHTRTRHTRLNTSHLTQNSHKTWSDTELLKPDVVQRKDNKDVARHILGKWFSYTKASRELSRESTRRYRQRLLRVTPSYLGSFGEWSGGPMDGKTG